MQGEYQKYLRTAPLENPPDRQGHAIGAKSKTVKTQECKITFDISQAHEGDSIQKRWRVKAVLGEILCAERFAL